MIERLKKDLKEDKMEKSEAAIAAAIINSEYFKSRVQTSTTSISDWKNKLD